MTSGNKTLKHAQVFFLILICLNSFSQNNDSAWMNKYMKEYYQDTGTYLPDLPLFEKNGTSTAIKNYHGKLVYIDFWASWCGNCINKFPHAEQLRKRLAVFGLDTLIHFIYINVDDTPKERRNAMEKYQPEGINLYSGDTTIFKIWNIKTIPRYILLDTSGKVLAKNMASPDDATIDYVLYAASIGVHPVAALQKYFEQNKLMEKYHTPDAITDKDFREWYIKSSPYRIAYYHWRNGNKATNQNE